MAIDHPEPTEPEIVDSGVHVRDSESATASGWQITMVALLVVAILCVFFYGLTSQRVEIAGSTPPPATHTNVPATEQTKTNVGTTGQAPNAANPHGAAGQQQPQKTNAVPPQHNGGQNAAQPPKAPQTNQ